MALSGRLDELDLSEVMQLIAFTGKSGKLVIRDLDREGVVVFKDGKIVFAASESLREAVGSDIGAKELAWETEATEEPPPEEEGEGRLERMIRQQIEKVVRELLTWRSGSFFFDVVAIPEVQDIALDAGGFILERGVKPDELLLKTLTKLDERSRQGWERDLRAAAGQSQTEPRSDISGIFEAMVSREGGGVTWKPRRTGNLRGLASLRELVEEASRLKGAPRPLSVDVTLLLLRYAAQLLNRGVLFGVYPDAFRSVGQFGLPRVKERVLKLAIPRAQPSVLAQVCDGGRPYRGQLESCVWNDHLLSQLGGEQPFDVIVMPLVIETVPVAVLYGDNLPDATSIGAVDGLEILLREVTLALEKARLERRVEALERLQTS